MMMMMSTHAHRRDLVHIDYVHYSHCLPRFEVELCHLVLKTSCKCTKLASFSSSDEFGCVRVVKSIADLQVAHIRNGVYEYNDWNHS